MPDSTLDHIPKDEHDLASTLVEFLKKKYDSSLVVISDGDDRSSRPMIKLTVNTRRIHDYSIRINVEHRP